MIAAGINGSNAPSMKKTPGLTKPSSNSQKLQLSVQSKRQQASVPGKRQQQPACQNQRMQHQLQSQRPQGNGRQQSLQGRRPDGSVQGQRVGHNGSAKLHGRLKSEQKQLSPSSNLKVTDLLPLTQLGTPHIRTIQPFRTFVPTLYVCRHIVQWKSVQ
jgi:protein SPT2